LWRHPDFLRLWSAQTISELGSQISFVALPLAAIGPLHATAFEVAALATLGFAPFLLVGLPAGLWVDRLPQRLLLVVSDLARGVLLLSVPRESLLRELRVGFRLLTRNPYLRAGVVTAGVANFAYGIIWAVLLVYAVRTLHLSSATIGGVLAIGELGGVLGALAAQRIARAIGVGWAMIGATMALGPGWLLLGLAPRGAAAPVLAAGWALSSFAAVITAVVGTSVRLSLVPQHVMGRVVATNRVVIWGVVPLGSLAGGAVAAGFGLRTGLIAGGVISFGAIPPILFSPWRSLRELPGGPPLTAPGAELGEPGQ